MKIQCAWCGIELGEQEPLTDTRRTHANVSNDSASGAVVNNDVPVRIGADPQGATGVGYYFDGRIQRVLGQTWTSH